MTQANVQKGTFTGSYCVRNLPFTPRNAVATAESGGANLDLIVTTKAEPPNISVSGCNDPQVAISVWDASLDNGRNAAFSVWIED